jgi:hypothetical protein
MIILALGINIIKGLVSLDFNELLKGSEYYYKSSKLLNH